MSGLVKASILSLTVVFAVSCSSNSNETSIEVKEEVKVEHKEEKKPHSSPKEEMSLNNGERWPANFETTSGVHKMSAKMEAFSDKENEAAYSELVKAMKKDYSMIFKKCTMTGDAHDQLHTFLIPIGGLFKGMASEDLAKCQSSFDTLQKHLLTYDTYFE